MTNTLHSRLLYIRQAFIKKSDEWNAIPTEDDYGRYYLLYDIFRPGDIDVRNCYYKAIEIMLGSERLLLGAELKSAQMIEIFDIALKLAKLQVFQ